MSNIDKYREISDKINGITNDKEKYTGIRFLNAGNYNKLILHRILKRFRKEIFDFTREDINDWYPEKVYGADCFNGENSITLSDAIIERGNMFTKLSNGAYIMLKRKDS